jgi:hypothetical protein
MEDDETAEGRRNVVLVPQRIGQSLDEAEEPLTAGWNMCAVLDVTRGPETLRSIVVTLIEEGIKRVQNDLHAVLSRGSDHKRAPLNLILLMSGCFTR